MISSFQTDLIIDMFMMFENCERVVVTISEALVVVEEQ